MSGRASRFKTPEAPAVSVSRLQTPGQVSPTKISKPVQPVAQPAKAVPIKAAPKAKGPAAKAPATAAVAAQRPLTVFFDPPCLSRCLALQRSLDIAGPRDKMHPF